VSLRYILYDSVLANFSGTVQIVLTTGGGVDTYMSLCKALAFTFPLLGGMLAHLIAGYNGAM